MTHSNASHAWIERPVHFVHQNLLWFLLSLYVIAYLLPGPGLWIRQCSLGVIPWPTGGSLNLTLPVLMLAFLLFNAGLGTKTSELVQLRRQPGLLASGVIANTAVPLLFIAAFWLIGRSWHDAEELQNILVGLALVASMPIAGSSTAWAQNINGNLALSLGLVLITTVLSPWLTPLVMHTVGLMATGDYAEDLHELANQGASAFLALSVVLPSLLGIALHYVLKEERLQRVKPYLKLFNLVNLLLLSYSNAAISLPHAFARPDWDFLALILIVSSTYCALAFAAGWLIAQKCNATTGETASLMFGMGMNNNGSGLVLSSLALADHPTVMVPIIFYNLAQQICAGIVDRLLGKKHPESV
jgi:BASS family bile acid:Na+ symporter